MGTKTVPTLPGYYLGAAAGSAAGVKVMSVAGWSGLALFGITLASAALLFHSWSQIRRSTMGKKA